MPTLENDLIRVELDPEWPRPLRLERKGSGGLSCGYLYRKLDIYLNGLRSLSRVAPLDDGTYKVSNPKGSLSIILGFSLDGADLVLRLLSVEGDDETKLDRWSIPDLNCVVGGHTDSYLRHVVRHRNWSQHWTPGTTIYDGWEDSGLIGDAQAEPGPQWTNHACVWNNGICVAACSSVHVRPLVTHLQGDGRANRFTISPGPHSYRLRGEIAEPFEFRIGILGDYNGDGKIDWADAAAWEGDRKLKSNPLYKDALVYKLDMDMPNLPAPIRTYASALEEIKQAHKVSGGRKQIVYLVGWQHSGHDTGYPCHTELNPRVGTLDDFKRLIEEAKAYNCTVSLHGNYDDSYPDFPEYREDLLCRTGTRKHVWFHNGLFDKDVYSISHTLANVSGYNEDRTSRLLELLPIKESIQLDAHRCFNEVYDEGIDAECEIQRGMIPIKKLFESRGLDVTIEGADDEVNGLYSWVWILPDWNHRYRTVMHHGRTGGMWRANLPSGRDNLHPSPEGEALGQFFFRTERDVDTPETMEEHLYLHWMTATLLQRKKMTDLWTGDWNQGVRATYEHCTYSTTGTHGQPLEIWYEGIPIARGTDRFLPWSSHEIFAYSLNGGRQEWPLPNGWDSVHVSASRLGETVEPPEVEIDEQYIGWYAPARTVVRFTRTTNA